MDSGEALKLKARAAAASLDWAATEAACRRSLEVNGESEEDLLLLGQSLRRQKKFSEGVELLDRLRGARSSDEATVQAYLDLAHCLSGLKRRAEAEERLREAAALSQDARIQVELAENLYAQRKLEAAQEAAGAALALDPGQTRARAVLSLARQSGADAPSKARIVVWPQKSSSYADLRRLIQTTLLPGEPEIGRFIRPGSRFVALGSCFADNLAQHLCKCGYDAHSEVIGEQVNNTWANRRLLEWVEHGVRNNATQLMQDAFGEEVRERYLDKLADCDVFVFTLGVAPTFFTADTGEFFFVNTAYVSYRALLDRCVMRMTTVAENVENLREIVATVRRIARREPKIVLTVSPVPLAATAEMASVVIADCLSKSTLRLACDEVVRGEPGDAVTYWPSFEIVRWLSPHYGQFHPPSFGADDGKARHVSSWLVALIIDLFLERFSLPQQEASA
jgi:tetratricopeptide (TPR) repeat protein